MPFKWDADAERSMLMYLIKACDLRPPPDAFTGVATTLGGGVNANACSQKFYKLKRESEQLLANGSAPGTPTTSTPSKAKAKAKAVPTPKSTDKGRKRKTDADEDVDVAATPSKKPKKEDPVEQADDVEGEDDDV